MPQKKQPTNKELHQAELDRMFAHLTPADVSSVGKSSTQKDIEKFGHSINRRFNDPGQDFDQSVFQRAAEYGSGAPGLHERRVKATSDSIESAGKRGMKMAGLKKKEY